MVESLIDVESVLSTRGGFGGLSPPKLKYETQ